jgi:enoyl-CoA hydratase/carnithine racemase
LLSLTRRDTHQTLPVVAHDDLMAQSVELAHRVAGVPAEALQATKLALNTSLDAQLDRSYKSPLQAELHSMHSPEQLRRGGSGPATS